MIGHLKPDQDNVLVVGRRPKKIKSLMVKSSATRVDLKGLCVSGGEGGIRTHGTFDSTPDFESGTFDHSATSP